MVTFYEVLELVGMLGELIGTLTIAYAALAVHHRVRNEHKIDDAVFAEMKHENVAAVVGVFLIIGGFFLQVLVRFILT